MDENSIDDRLEYLIDSVDNILDVAEDVWVIKELKEVRRELAEILEVGRTNGTEASHPSENRP